MTKQEAIDILADLKKRITHAPDSYDSETDIQAIEVGIESILGTIALDNYIKNLQKSR